MRVSQRARQRQKVGRKINEIRDREMKTRKREKISAEAPNNLEASENTHRINYAEHVTRDALRLRHGAKSAEERSREEWKG